MRRASLQRGPAQRAPLPFTLPSRKREGGGASSADGHIASAGAKWASPSANPASESSAGSRPPGRPTSRDPNPHDKASTPSAFGSAPSGRAPARLHAGFVSHPTLSEHDEKKVVGKNPVSALVDRNNDKEASGDALPAGGSEQAGPVSSSNGSRQNDGTSSNERPNAWGSLNSSVSGQNGVHSADDKGGSTPSQEQGAPGHVGGTDVDWADELDSSAAMPFAGAAALPDVVLPASSQNEDDVSDSQPSAPQRNAWAKPHPPRDNGPSTGFSPAAMPQTNGPTGPQGDGYHMHDLRHQISRRPSSDRSHHGHGDVRLQHGPKGALSVRQEGARTSFREETNAVSFRSNEPPGSFPSSASDLSTSGGPGSDSVVDASPANKLGGSGSSGIDLETVQKQQDVMKRKAEDAAERRRQDAQQEAERRARAEQKLRELEARLKAREEGPAAKVAGKPESKPAASPTASPVAKSAATTAAKPDATPAATPAANPAATLAAKSAATPATAAPQTGPKILLRRSRMGDPGSSPVSDAGRVSPSSPVACSLAPGTSSALNSGSVSTTLSPTGKKAGTSSAVESTNGGRSSGPSGETAPGSVGRGPKARRRRAAEAHEAAHGVVKACIRRAMKASDAGQRLGGPMRTPSRTEESVPVTADSAPRGQHKEGASVSASSHQTDARPKKSRNRSSRTERPKRGRKTARNETSLTSNAACPTVVGEGHPNVAPSPVATGDGQVGEGPSANAKAPEIPSKSAPAASGGKSSPGAWGVENRPATPRTFDDISRAFSNHPSNFPLALAPVIPGNTVNAPSLVKHSTWAGAAAASASSWSIEDQPSKVDPGQTQPAASGFTWATGTGPDQKEPWDSAGLSQGPAVSGAPTLETWGPVEDSPAPAVAVDERVDSGSSVPSTSLTTGPGPSKPGPTERRGKGRRSHPQGRGQRRNRGSSVASNKKNAIVEDQIDSVSNVSETRNTEATPGERKSCQPPTATGDSTAVNNQSPASIPPKGSTAGKTRGGHRRGPRGRGGRGGARARQKVGANGPVPTSGGVGSQGSSSK